MFRGSFGSRAVNNYLALLSCWLAEELRLVAVTKSLCYLGGEISKTQNTYLRLDYTFIPGPTPASRPPSLSVHPTGRAGLSEARDIPL